MRPGIPRAPRKTFGSKSRGLDKTDSPPAVSSLSALAFSTATYSEKLELPMTTSPALKRGLELETTVEMALLFIGSPRTKPPM